MILRCFQKADNNFKKESALWINEKIFTYFLLACVLSYIYDCIIVVMNPGLYSKSD